MNEIYEKWSQFAEEDFRIAEMALRGGFLRGCSFNYEQSIEKYLKSLLLKEGVITEKKCRDIGHNMQELFEKSVLRLPKLADILPQAPFIAEFVRKRYPNGGSEVSAEDVKQLAKIARRVRKLVKEHFKIK